MRSPVGGEIGEAPPVADETSRFRGSAPIGGHDSARQSVGTTVGKRAPPLRKRNKNYGEAGRRGRRPLQSSIGEWCVGDDAYIVPPLPAIKLSVGADASVRPPMLYRTSCKRCHCEASAHTGCGNPRPLWICAGVLRIPTTSLRTGLGMTREFLRLLSLVVAIRIPVPKAPLPKGGWHGEAVTGGFLTSPHPLQPFRRGDPCGRPWEEQSPSPTEA